MRQPQRYTGPELGALLREVRSELGENAEIHEANRIREGGVAGFFRREAFEVLASAASSAGAIDTTVSWDAPANDWLESDDTRIEPSIAGLSFRGRRKRGKQDLDVTESSDTLTADDELVAKLTAAMESERAWADSIGTTAADMPPPPTVRLPPRRFGPQDLAPLPDEPVTTLATALLEAPAPSPAASGDGRASLGDQRPTGNRLLERADSVSTQDRVGQLLAGAQELINDRSLAHRTAVGSVGKTPVETAEPDTEQTAAAKATEATAPSPGPKGATDRHTPKPIRQLPVERPGTRGTTLTPAPRRPQADSGSVGAPQRAESFWSDLTELETFLPVRPTACADVQLLVGPLDVALPLASRFAVDQSVELHVLSDEVQLVGVEPQQMAESSRDLSVRLARRTNRAVGVVEADDSRRGDGESLDRMLPPRMLTLIDRVCADAGVDLIRLTLRSLAPIEEMTDLVNSFPVPCAIDLAIAPDSAALEKALTARLPIVSVAGRQLTPALALALKRS